MSVLIFLILSAVCVTVDEAMERRQERREWARRAPRRARQYTFN